ncbi:Protein CBG12247 [Caenorhabditis briggsae]|uniref:Protein CBG12247 n=1 Tax=Caenorhabditis briggsae TaxID=6238 RepID=A8XF32_CAEBR|nr:Protein CBG12247 [Caenorhabditis briggsae]CAP31254.1 Protein CBG12247 [Caenorhabditis briggsae]
MPNKFREYFFEKKTQKTVFSALFHPFSRRLHIILLCMVGFLCTTFMRIHFALTMTCMVNSTALAVRNEAAAAAGNSNFSLVEEIDLVTNGQCGSAEDTGQQKVVVDYGGDLVWTSYEQNLIFSGTFWGSLITVLPSMFFIERFSPRHVLQLAVAAYILVTVITPFLATHFGYFSVFLARVGMGLGEGFIIPTNNAIIGNWFPSAEKSTALSIFTLGNQIASAGGSPVVAALCASDLGWQATFYFAGGLEPATSRFKGKSVTMSTNAPTEERIIMKRNRCSLEEIMRDAEEKVYKWRKDQYDLKVDGKTESGNNETFGIDSIVASGNEEDVGERNSDDGTFLTDRSELNEIEEGETRNAWRCQSNQDLQRIYFLVTTTRILATIWSIIWFFTASSHPSKVKIMTKKEREYLLANTMKKINKSKKSPSVPYAKILTSPAFLAQLQCQFFVNMVMTLFQIYLPAYFKEVLHLGVIANGTFTSIPNIFNMIFKIVWGIGIDRLKEMKILSNTAALATVAPSLYSFSLSSLTAPTQLLLLLSYALCTLNGDICQWILHFIAQLSATVYRNSVCDFHVLCDDWEVIDTSGGEFVEEGGL